MKINKHYIESTFVADKKRLNTDSIYVNIDELIADLTARKKAGYTIVEIIPDMSPSDIFMHGVDLVELDFLSAKHIEKKFKND